MTTVEIANEIGRRVDLENLPSDIVKFQERIRGICFVGDTPELDCEINEFSTSGYRTLELLSKGYCSSCNQIGSCNWNQKVRNAAGEGCLFWLSMCPSVEFPKHNGFPRNEVVFCTHYQSDKLTSEGISEVRQPLERLSEIISKNKE